MSKQRLLLSIAAVVVCGALVWLWLGPHDDAKVVARFNDPAESAAAHKKLRVMDVLAGFAGTSTPERGYDSDGRIMWTSDCSLIGGERCTFRMKMDPGDLYFASMTVPMRLSDGIARAHIAVAAKHFLQNVAPEFDGGAAWFDGGLAALVDQPEQNPSTRTNRATFSLRCNQPRAGEGMTLDFKLNR